MGLLLFVPAVRRNIKLFKTVADNIVYRGRTNFVASECFHQTSAFQFGQCLTGPLSLRYGRGISVYDRQGFQHPFKINSRGIFAFSLYGKFLFLLFKRWSI